MGKKRQRAHQVSKGIHHQKPNKWRKMIRRDYVGSTAQILNKLNAWLKGKNVMLTIENPNKNETNKRFIRVNANDVWRRKTT